jgi:uncharacterized membrane protein YhaH (DUF805 family)
MHHFSNALAKYATFSGRASRAEYWQFVLISFLLGVGVLVVDQAVGAKGGVFLFYRLALLIPTIAVGVRRMHDTGRSGLWLVVPVMNLVFTCMRGDQGSNKHGADPYST